MKDNGIPPDSLDSGKTKILVVDDDPEIVELFVDVLERDGRFEVKTASTGYDAGMITQEFNPDLLILDYMLPDINGNVVCKTIRQKPEFEHTKIIIVSGVVNQDEVQRAAQERRRRVRQEAVQYREAHRTHRGTAAGLKTPSSVTGHLLLVTGKRPVTSDK
jgi:CheY-like chemotaxis protein